MKDKLLKKFNLEDSVAGGPLTMGNGSFVDLSNIPLLDKGEDYLIHIESLPQHRRYVYSVYEKKK